MAINRLLRSVTHRLSVYTGLSRNGCWSIKSESLFVLVLLFPTKRRRNGTLLGMLCIRKCIAGYSVPLTSGSLTYKRLCCLFMQGS